jgi:predicted HAD superfamily Cof-like phosphohydrolase
MKLNFVKRICKWNTDRGNVRGEIDKNLEQGMLDEELEEFKDAESAVDELDALVDLIFVAIGSMHKLGLNPQEIEKAINIVCDANDKKLSDKKKGKIAKPKDFTGPEEELQKILNKIKEGKRC